MMAIALLSSGMTMAEQDKIGRCAVCGGPVGKDGRTVTPVPSRPAARVPAPPTPKMPVDDAPDDLTPVQRFERALQRRDAARPKRPSERGKEDDPAG